MGEVSQAAESLGGAIQMGGEVPGLVSAAQQAFASGYSVVLIVSAGLIVVLALIVWKSTNVLTAAGGPTASVTNAAKTEGHGAT